MNWSATASPWLLVGLIAVVLGMLWAVSFWTKGSSGERDRLIKEYRRLKGLLQHLGQHEAAAQASLSRDFVVQSDVWLGQVLSYNGYGETTIGEKLKSAKLKTSLDRGLLNDLWFLHKLRNRTVHDNHQPSKHEIDESLSVLDKMKQHLV